MPCALRHAIGGLPEQVVLEEVGDGKIEATVVKHLKDDVCVGLVSDFNDDDLGVITNIVNPVDKHIRRLLGETGKSGNVAAG